MTEREAVGLLFEAYHSRRDLTLEESDAIEEALPTGRFVVTEPIARVASVPETLRAMREHYLLERVRPL